MDKNNIIPLDHSVRVKAPQTSEILEAMRIPLSFWLGQDEIYNWLNTVKTLPRSNNIFIELQPNYPQHRCDIITNVQLADGTLPALLKSPIAKTTPVWRKTSAMLKEWQQQLHSRQGFLRTHCFSMWLEFDIYAQELNPGDPSVFIDTIPQAKIAELAEELIDYRDFQHAILRSKTALEEVMGSDTIVLGHIGYMASRQKENIVLPLRTCWRCYDISHLYHLLKLMGISFNNIILQEQLDSLNGISEYINSIMLDVDSNATFMSDFSLEFNVFKPYSNSSQERESTVLQKIVELGLINSEQKQKLLKFSNTYSLNDDQKFMCSLHHFKFKFTNSRVKEVKCYWKGTIKQINNS